MKNKLLVVLTAAVLPLLTLHACSKKSAPEQSAAAQELYRCPMHPQVTSNKPGDCPICHMRLVKVEPEPAPAAKAEHKILYYRNPMDPKVTSPVPAKDSMGMDYVPVYADEVSAATVPGQAPVQLSADAEQKIGVVVASASVRDLVKVVRASARVAYDPGLYSAILEHQEAVRAAQQAAQGTPMQSDAQATVRASRLRLRQLGLSDAQIGRAGQPGFDPANLLLGRSGGSVWVYAELFDYEAPAIRPGQRAEITSNALPGQVFNGRVRSIDTVVNAETRTLRARIETPDPEGVLKPEMYLDARIFASMGQVLVIPASAVIDTGTRQMTFVQTSTGRYEPRQLRLGRRGDRDVEVISGLKAGERVAVSANFLLDSESKLRAAAGGAQ